MGVNFFSFGGLVMTQWGTVVGWVNVLGSMAAIVAAVVTVWLARRQMRAKLERRFQVENMPMHEVDALPMCMRQRYDSLPVQLEITVLNMGSAPEIIHDICMQVGSGKNMQIDVLGNPDAMGHDPNYDYSEHDFSGRERLQCFPVALSGGKYTKWRAIVGEEEYPDDWGKEFFKGLVTTAHDAKKLRFFLHTNHGRKKKIKPESDVIEPLTKWAA
ncbi:MAG: hypothetical protein MPK31_06045 [Gammaproteobacteria bacterium]|nr:hypothetical protein [Gammaproteobacteria bacterium]